MSSIRIQLCRSPKGLCTGETTDHLFKVADEDVLAGYTGDVVSLSIANSRFSITSNGEISVVGGPYDDHDFEAANGVPIEVVVRASSAGPKKIGNRQVAFSDITIKVCTQVAV